MPIDSLPSSEPEVLDARLPYVDGQAALMGAPIARGVVANSCGWFGTKVLMERGWFALVRRGGPLEEFVGDRLKLTYGKKVLYVYCVGTADAVDVPQDLGLTRQAYLRLERLTVDEIDVLVEAVQG